MATDEKNVEELNVSASQTGISLVSPAPVRDYKRLAELVAIEGKPFYQSALDCGFPKHIAVKGPAHLQSVSQEFSTEFRKASTRVLSRGITLDSLKPLAIARLHREITDPDSGLGIKAIELAGRFKETDWFVRNSDAQIGIFVGISEEKPINVPDTYSED